MSIPAASLLLYTFGLLLELLPMLRLEAVHALQELLPARHPPFDAALEREDLDRRRHARLRGHLRDIVLEPAGAPWSAGAAGSCAALVLTVHDDHMRTVIMLRRA
jgi:hypothetical protein